MLVLCRCSCQSISFQLSLIAFQFEHGFQEKNKRQINFNQKLSLTNSTLPKKMQMYLWVNKPHKFYIQVQEPTFCFLMPTNYTCCTCIKGSERITNLLFLATFGFKSSLFKRWPSSFLFWVIIIMKTKYSYLGRD